MDMPVVVLWEPSRGNKRVFYKTVYMMEKKTQDSYIIGSTEQMSLEPAIGGRGCGGHAYHEWEGVLSRGKDGESPSTV